MLHIEGLYKIKRCSAAIQFCMTADSYSCIADGFPRTALQVDFLKLLYDKMLELHNKHADGPEEWQYPRPSFKVHIWPEQTNCLLAAPCTDVANVQHVSTCLELAGSSLQAMTDHSTGPFHQPCHWVQYSETPRLPRPMHL